MIPCIFHVDMDAFFASVEQSLNKEYQGKPVIVGGLPQEPRSVVATCSYEARRFGVHSAMPSSVAYRLCPKAIFVHANMPLYMKISKKIMGILSCFSPTVEQLSCDEAFLDMTGCEGVYASSLEAAVAIKQAVKAETGLTISVGIATSHYLAKIASGLKKPDGLCQVQKGCEAAFMEALPLSKLWGVGERTQERLQKAHLCDVKTIKRASVALLQSIVGRSCGEFLYKAVRGLVTDNFAPHDKASSISTERTFSQDLYDRSVIDEQLFLLCDDLIFRALREGISGNVARLKVRYDDFATISLQETRSTCYLCTDSFFDTIKRLFDKKYKEHMGIRLLGVSLSNLKASDEERLLSFDSKEEKLSRAQKAICDIKSKERMPEIFRASSLIKK